MKTVIWINRIIGAILTPLVFLYMFTGFEETSKQGWLYYPELLGWVGDTNIIYLGQDSWFVGIMTLLGAILICRYIVYIVTSFDNNNEAFSYHASQNVSNILDIIYVYIFTNVLMSGFYLESSGWIIFLCILLAVIFVFWKSAELINATDDSSHWGLFDFRKAMFKYYNSTQDYESHVETLTNNYKRLIA